MEQSQEFTGRTYQLLEERCKALGISIYQLCKLSGVPQNNVSQWKPKEPKTLRTLRRLEDTLKKMENEKI